MSAAALSRAALARRPLVEVRLTPSALAEALCRDALAGLTAVPKEIPPKWLYDECGCALFEAITRLPEYYPTRREREILERRATEIAALSGADALVELGSGSSEKTRILLEALVAAGLRRFVALDMSEAVLRSSADGLAREYPTLEVRGVVGDFERHLPALPGGGRRLVVFLGGTIGNLPPVARARMLATLARVLDPGETFLVGVDLVKDVGRLQAAYDDAAGVTAAFNRNVLHVLNRGVGAAFDPRLFEHVARFDRREEWIEMRLRATVAHDVPVRALGLRVRFEEGEEMRTEISAKFRREGIEGELRAAGLVPVAWWTDTAGDFALSLARRVPGAALAPRL